MHRGLTAVLSSLLALAGTAALALAQGGVGAPGEGPPRAGAPTAKTLYEDGHGGRYLLDGRWWFRLDPDDTGETDGLPSAPGLDGWTEISVPNAWNAGDESDASQRGTVGWYRRDFTLPSSSLDLEWRLRFESANYRAKVWVNGEPVGEHEGAFVPFEVPALGLVRDGVNRLVVRVDSRRLTGDIPRGGDRANGRPSGGWWNYGGLLREVYLRRFEHVDIAAVRVRPRLARSRRSARLDVRVAYDNPTAKRARFRLHATVDGVTMRSKPISLRAGGRLTRRYQVKVEKPRLWEPLAPELYPIELETFAGKRRLSSYSLHVGIRDIRVDERGSVRIDGRRVKLFGASLHEDNPVRGAALLPADRRRDLRRLRELGATLIRAHYPLHPHYLEMADRMGLMVWDQVPVYSFGYKGHAVPGITQKSLDYVQAMVERDWNHPSVLTWSIGNELSPRMTSDQEDYIRRAARLIHGLDPTRLRAIDIFGYPQSAPADVYHELDSIGINTYFGWYPGPNGQTEDRDLLGPYLEQMRAYYSDLALFVTEFGAEANREGDASEKGTYAFQREHIRHHVRTYLRKPFLNGAIAWLLRDFRVRPDWEGGNPKPQPPWNQKGLMDQFGRKKPAFAEAARLFKSVPPIAPRR
jgi:beta-glucuronidase